MSMINTQYLIASFVVVGLAAGFWMRGPQFSPDGGGGGGTHADGSGTPAPDAPKVSLSEDEWRKKLTPEQYHVLREKGTERPWTGAYCSNHEAGIYKCAGCDAVLFDAGTKYESGSGWPSFYQPIAQGRVREIVDRAHGMVRTEVVCAACGGHLGHVFDDGPQPTGQRFCMNSASLKFEKK